jgi:hypothetical protein
MNITRTNNALKLLKSRKNELTAQQYRTFRGQILSGDVEGFIKGLQKVRKNGKTETSSR